MAQDYDVTLKKMLRQSNGVFAQLVLGGPIAEWLNVEQPHVSNRRADLLARVGPDPITGETWLCHIELQTTNDPQIGKRLLSYYAGFWDQFDTHTRQILVYLGPARLTMSDTYRTPSTTHTFRVITMAELDGEALLQSTDWVDNELALLTKADRERVYAAVIRSLQRLDPAARKEAATLFVLISGIIGIEEQTNRRLELDMLDIMENKVLGPMVQREIDKAEERGRQEGRRLVLTELLTRRFGPLPATLLTRLDDADQSTLMLWTERLLTSPELGVESILRSPK